MAGETDGVSRLLEGLVGAVGNTGCVSQKAAFRTELVSLMRNVAGLPAFVPEPDLTITPTEAKVLDVLCEHEALTMSEIKDYTGFSCGGELLRLARRGMVSSRKRATRSTLWSVLPQGRVAARTPQKWAWMRDA